jgi:replicative DNA helicase
MGTSTLTLDFLRSAAIKNNLLAVLFSLDSCRTEVSMRLLCAESCVALLRWTAAGGRYGQVRQDPRRDRCISSHQTQRPPEARQLRSYSQLAVVAY